MRKIAFIPVSVLSLFGLMLLLTACPYSSTVPIDEGKKVPSFVLGDWISSADVEAENPTFYSISVLGENVAQLKKMEFSSTDSVYQPTRYMLTFSDVGGETFINVREEGQDNYSLLKLTMDEAQGTMTTLEVSDYVRETFDNSQDLKKFIAQNKNLSFFFTTSETVYQRK